MAKKQDDLHSLIRSFKNLPSGVRTIVAVIGIVVVGIFVWQARDLWDNTREQRDAEQTGPPGTYLFCFWNVENLYDDEDDPNFDVDPANPRTNQAEEEDWFARDPGMLRLKLDNLADALLKMNGGAGPDILAMCEVESQRSVELLRETLNARLQADGRADQLYQHIAFIENNTGRRFAPAVLSRINIEGNRVRKFGKASDAGDGRRASARTLIAPLRYNGHELIIMVGHWTSRVTDDEGPRRLAYADDTYGEFKAIVLANPDADVILCGDYNDEFADESIQVGLKASAAEDSVRDALTEPRPFALTANIDTNQIGTIYYEGDYQVFDHILLSRGMLDDRGWNFERDTFSIFAPAEMRYQGKGPSSFGNPTRMGERGFSDHFPVTVRVRVAAGAEL